MVAMQLLILAIFRKRVMGVVVEKPDLPRANTLAKTFGFMQLNGNLLEQFDLSSGNRVAKLNNKQDRSNVKITYDPADVPGFVE
jgi:hypothetical protein